jgi:NAD-dependent SIR2 family protein deacetylase
MLERKHDRASKKKDGKWATLKQLLTNVDYDSSAFLSMNWDEVVEFRFWAIHSMDKVYFDYGCNATHARISSDKSHIVPVIESKGPSLRIVKMHGSVNWLYCDNCQQIFWFSPGNGTRISEGLLSAVEWQKITPGRKSPGKPWMCPFCITTRLSTRLATFSYRKALDFPMFHKSWFTAEALLREADTWAFIGYSMPAADYEFKYLLKRISLSRQPLPRIVLVTGGADAEATLKNYQQFFGSTLKVGTNCFLSGLDSKSIECLLHY